MHVPLTKPRADDGLGPPVVLILIATAGPTSDSAGASGVKIAL